MVNGKSELVDKVLPHLRTQFERGLAILFTGAGFSRNARNLDGEPLPTGDALTRKIWSLCFPSDPFEASASLQDVYEAALLKDSKGLKDLLTRQLTVDPQSIDEHIARYFYLSWYRVYTLNIDNIPDAVSRRFPLARPLVEISATNPSSSKHPSSSSYTALEVYYLNGRITDAPNDVTFAATQYAKRLVFPDHFYQELVADIVSRPVVFVGTRLEEPSLWQNIEIRRMKGSRGLNELRPRSYLVIPTLDRARQARLSEFNIQWIPMTAEEFSNEILKNVSAASEEGLKLFKVTKVGVGRLAQLPEVGDLATTPNRQSEFLLGQEPIWADIQSGRAIKRACDDIFWEDCQRAISAQGHRGIILITGTAGSGKSTSLMRIALRATAEGHRVAWVDRDNELSPREIISAMKNDSSPPILAIDDADLFGSSLSTMLLDMVSDEGHPLLIVAVRSGVVDRVIDSVVLEGVPIKELSVPHLTDTDIDSLIEILDRENRLGAVKGKPKEYQCAKFREYADRQLLVAMLSVTAGGHFQLKVPDEFNDLPADMQRVYSLVALATSFRFRPSRRDILIGLNDSTNAALNTIDLLLRRHILVDMPPGSGQLQVRHRVIADLVRDDLQRHGRISDAIFCLAFLAATYKRPGAQRNHRATGLLRSVINHDFLYRNLGRDSSQLLYQNLEDMLSDHPHYWLQRGSLEVEFGDLLLAENFLSQARGLSTSHDLYIDNEWAYLLFKKALANPGATGAGEYVAEATKLAESIIQDQRVSPHPFHVLGSQGLAWSRVGITRHDEKAKYLLGLKAMVEKGLARYPKSNDLRQLRDDLQREYLSLALSPPRQ